jgi:uncharacterized membrane protein
MKRIWIGLMLAFIAISAFSLVTTAQEQEKAIVQAILFYRPSCPHCHDVIENHLPLIKQEFGDQLQLVGIDTSNRVGAELYEKAVAALDIPEDRLGVPTLIVDDIVLVGGQEIPERLPKIVEAGLESGGIAWPAIPGLQESIPNLPPPAGQNMSNPAAGPTGETSETLMTEALPSDSQSPQSDPVGFALALGVMFGLVSVVVFAVVRFLRSRPGFQADVTVLDRYRGYSIPTLALLGLGVSAYLSYVEISQTEAVCGPVGECNIVQSSQYAQIFGVPIALIGALFYLLILGLWLSLRQSRADWTRWIPVTLLLLSGLGVLFSIYLTALELFVIKAVCAWCLGSAVLTAMLLFVTSIKLTKEDIDRPQDRQIAAQTS